MFRYLVSRVLQAVVVVIGVVTVVFILEHLMPGDQGHSCSGRARARAVGDLRPPERARPPIFVQYFDFLKNRARADRLHTARGSPTRSSDPGCPGRPEPRFPDRGTDDQLADPPGLSTALVVAATVPIALYEASAPAERRTSGEHRRGRRLLDPALPAGHAADRRALTDLHLAQPQCTRTGTPVTCSPIPPP